jgi:transcriptional regulator with XRE-family HTH domain
MADASRPQAARTAIRHPLAGIAIDPRKLAAVRAARGLSRQGVVDGIDALHWEEEPGVPLHRSRNAIAKYESGERNPKAIVFRALCEVLHAAPAHLLYDGELLRVSEEQLALGYLRQLREYADSRGEAWPDGEPPPAELREAYARHLAYGPRALAS